MFWWTTEIKGAAILSTLISVLSITHRQKKKARIQKEGSSDRNFKYNAESVKKDREKSYDTKRKKIAGIWCRKWIIMRAYKQQQTNKQKAIKINWSIITQKLKNWKFIIGENKYLIKTSIPVLWSCLLTGSDAVLKLHPEFYQLLPFKQYLILTIQLFVTLAFSWSSLSFLFLLLVLLTVLLYPVTLQSNLYLSFIFFIQINSLCIQIKPHKEWLGEASMKLSLLSGVICKCNRLLPFLWRTCYQLWS